MIFNYPTILFTIFTHMLCLGSLEAFASQIGPDQYKESLIQINFPDTVPLETSPSHDLMSLSIYRSLNVKEVQSQKQEVMDLNSLPLKIQYNHYKKKITFENNNLTCEERSFYGASLRMNYSCQIEVDPRWLIPSSEKNKLSFIGPFAEALHKHLSPNQNIQCKKNLFTTQCQIQTSATNLKQDKSYSTFAQVCSNTNQARALNLQQLALAEDKQRAIEQLRSDYVNLTALENNISTKWKIHNPKLSKEFKNNIFQIQKNIINQIFDLDPYNQPYYLAKPAHCELTPILNYDSVDKKFHIQASIWNNLPEFDRSWIILKSALQMTLKLNHDDRLRSDQWLFDLLVTDNMNTGFKAWTEQIYALDSQILETPFLNSTALISANEYFEFSMEGSYIQKGFLTQAQNYFLLNQNVTLEKYYSLYSKEKPRELFITSPFSSMIRNKIFDWQSHRRYLFFKNGQIEFGTMTLSPPNPNLRIQSKTLNLQIIGGNYKGCEQSNIQLNSNGQILAACGVIGYVLWNGDWIEIAKEYRVDFKNEKELLCGTSLKTQLHPVNEYSFEPLPSYYIPPCGGL